MVAIAFQPAELGDVVGSTRHIELQLQYLPGSAHITTFGPKIKSGDFSSTNGQYRICIFGPVIGLLTQINGARRLGNTNYHVRYHVHDALASGVRRKMPRH